VFVQEPAPEPAPLSLSLAEGQEPVPSPRSSFKLATISQLGLSPATRGLHVDRLTTDGTKPAELFAKEDASGALVMPAVGPAEGVPAITRRCSSERKI
jgi:hypothetical protein